MKSNPNEPGSAPRRAEKGWVILAWAVAGFLLGNLLLQPQPSPPLSQPSEERPAAAAKAPAPPEADYADRPGRERPDSRERVYRDLGAALAAEPVAVSAAQPAKAEPLASAPLAPAVSAPAAASTPEAPSAPGPAASVTETVFERPGRPEGRPESREQDERGAVSYSD